MGSKLEGFCKGTYMCGSSPQSGDFHVFEMIDRHKSIAEHVGEADPMADCPKLKALYDAMKSDAKLAKYFESDCHKEYAQNNGLITHYTGRPADFKYPNTKKDSKTF